MLSDANVAGGLAPGRRVQPLQWQMSANISCVQIPEASSIKIQTAGLGNLKTQRGNSDPVVANDRGAKASDPAFRRSC